MKINGDRLVAFLIINGEVFDSDSDHQECLYNYRRKYGLLKENDNYTHDDFENAIKETYQMKESHTAYGFDLFEIEGSEYVLLAHDKETLDANREWALKYANENDAKLGYFTNDSTSSYEAVLEDIA